VTIEQDINAFVRAWFPVPSVGHADHSFVHVERGEIVAHLGLNLRVLTVEPGHEVVHGGDRVHVGVLVNAAVRADRRGHGLMRLLKVQAIEYASTIRLPFLVSISRYPEPNLRLGFKAAPNYHEDAVVLRLGALAWPECRVSLS
jgi:GNAT superfamily N-acetyltransferase